MPDMSEFHETDEEMEDRCDAQRECEIDYHDCPGAALGTCDPTDPKSDCPYCGGAKTCPRPLSPIAEHL